MQIPITLAEACSPMKTQGVNSEAALQEAVSCEPFGKSPVLGLGVTFYSSIT